MTHTPDESLGALAVVRLRLQCSEVTLWPVREADLEHLAAIQLEDYEHDPGAEVFQGLDAARHRNRLVYQDHWRSIGQLVARFLVLGLRGRIRGASGRYPVARGGRLFWRCASSNPARGSSGRSADEALGLRCGGPSSAWRSNTWVRARPSPQLVAPTALLWGLRSSGIPRQRGQLQRVRPGPDRTRAHATDSGRLAVVKSATSRARDRTGAMSSMVRPHVAQRAT